jgi:hypothetical protein
MRRLVLAIVLVLCAPASAQALPDLTISLPTEGSIAPVYVDTFQEPGKVLYRFDALIHNEGDTLDLFREPSGAVKQAVWPPGQPTSVQHPGERPGTDDIRDAGEGARIEFVVEETHRHFHFFTAARYSLDVPGAPPRVSGKIGFCMFDTFDTGGVSLWFPPDRDWCHDVAEPGFVRMGLSPGAADRYSAQREFQYVDVTGLAPGMYLLRGVANPEGHVLEADGEPDEHTEMRLIPGVTADAASATTGAGAPVAIPLAARAIGTAIPARARASCRFSQASSCYRYAQPGGPLTFAAVTAPAHGTVAFDGARAVYTPAAGFSGTDSFSYTATDERGLVSAPAVVDVRVAAPSPAPAVAAAKPRKLLKILRARRAGRRAVSVRVLCRPAAATACVGALTARVAGRVRGSRGFASLPAGRRRTVRVGLSRAWSRRRGVVVVAAVRDAAGVGVAARRVFRAGALAPAG